MAAATLVATAVFLGLGHLARSAGEGQPKPRRWAALALSAGVLAGIVTLLGPPTSPFGEDSLRATDRLFFSVALVGLLGLSSRRWALGLGALFVPFLVVAMYKDVGESLLSWAAYSAIGLVLMDAGDRVIRMRTGPVGVVQIGIVLGLVPAAIALSGSAAYGQLAGTVGLAFGLVTLLAWRNWNAGLVDGASAMLAMGAFALMAVRYSELEPLHAALLLGALPLSNLATARLKRRKRLVGWLVLLLPMVIALVLIAMSFEPDPYAAYK